MPTLRALLAIGLLAAGFVAAPAAPSAPTLESDYDADSSSGGVRESDDGTVDLSWNVPEGADSSRFELQSAGSESFDQAETLYTGPDTASVRTGLREGTYYFRVRILPESGEPGAWSNVLPLKVDYMSTPMLAFLLITGFLVAAATAAAIIAGFVKSKSAK